MSSLLTFLFTNVSERLAPVALLSRYQLLFYQKDGSVEMFDGKNQRTLLRRTKCHDLHQEDLFVGNRVNVFSCQLNLILGSKRGMKQAADFYTEHQTKSFFNFFMLGFSDTWKQFMTSGPGVAMELMGEEAVSRPDQASEPLDDTRNAGHRSDSLASAARELEFFFPATAGHGPAKTATDCACCVINPHAISEGKEDLLIFHMERSLTLHMYFFIMLFRGTRLCGVASPLLAVPGRDSNRTWPRCSNVHK
uniref:DM10 domain-containing protein n=1 Tax=Oncorhynchus tshawytscha TaxID=74940 RepID=A0AAZ3RGU2_ONCTS